MYHRVGPIDGDEDAKYAVTPGRFAAQMRALADAGFHAVPIDEFVAWLDGGPALAPGSFVVTFDDGYLGVREHALPVLQELGWPFAVFLVTGLLGKRDAWPRFDSLDAARHPLLDTRDVLAMHACGVAFHSHSRSHASLPGLDDATLASELSESRSALCRLLGRDAPSYLAYPYGHVDARVELVARTAGYRAAFSVQPGFNRSDTPPFRIRRLDVLGTDTPGQLVRKLQFGSNDGSWRNALRYYWGRAKAGPGREAA
jgi:peptidoglycan/xylan/chitin deacetylase (PgdA/CDA1 family)